MVQVSCITWYNCQGHGLRCQRAISAICELAGIKDIRAKITGPTTPINVVQATFKTLLSQVGNTLPC